MSVSAAGHLPVFGQGLPPRLVHERAPRRRRALADGIYGVLSRAEKPVPSGYSAVVPVLADEVRRARPTLFALAARFRDPAPVPTEAVDLVRRLLRDGGGPLYIDHGQGSVRAVAIAALRSCGEEGP